MMLFLFVNLSRKQLTLFGEKLKSRNKNLEEKYIQYSEKNVKNDKFIYLFVISHDRI
ncbi:hypothetical protein NCCP133_05170 [Cytobacillus sp. NCCP-133]|nr:hypothetical protein NCCP133_05170 [Cytobacillus sp. NCCP-133]